MRGADSTYSWLKKQPQAYVLAYQGSESSTSQGILHVFEKAQKYLTKETNKKSESGKEDVLPIVLLDEVGLAEISPANPLKVTFNRIGNYSLFKVLHSLLEPGPASPVRFEGSVVGISNWALDAAKMNRAIHLQRPDPTVDDLFQTGKAIHTEKKIILDPMEDNTKTMSVVVDENILMEIAKAYYFYHKNQSTPNFHGIFEKLIIKVNFIFRIERLLFPLKVSPLCVNYSQPCKFLGKKFWRT